MRFVNTSSKDVEGLGLKAEIWREVSQHLELAESADRLALLLAEHGLARALVLARLESAPPRLLTVAASGVGVVELGGWPTRQELGAEAWAELNTALESGAPLRLDDRSWKGDVLPVEVDKPVLLIPLSPEGQKGGVAFVVLDIEHDNGVDELLFDLLAAPLTCAFENDRRIHELARMREALEADRQALLSKLKRQDISDVIVGASGGLGPIMDRVKQVAPTEAPVLILGETGSGKEVIARAIHSRSRRARGPIVRVNCGAIPSELVDSELFGHERGAFTGAVAQRKGWFERADGGTLFLDEVGELPAAAQVRLLRVLQDGALERVGGHQTIRVDVRIVAATHRKLETMVASGGFREDLWYRLSVFPLRLPSLRERLEDIAALALHFAEGAAQRLGSPGFQLTEGDIALLCRYPWPGNVRELAAVIERAAILGDGRKLDLKTAIGVHSIPPPPPPGPFLSSGDGTSSLPSFAAPALPKELGSASRPKGSKIPTLDEAMALHIEQALGACHGRIEGSHGAARLLGINPHTLRARMRKLGIDWSRFRPGGAEGETELE